MVKRQIKMGAQNGPHNMTENQITMIAAEQMAITIAACF
jgi:hypothetical protein